MTKLAVEYRGHHDAGVLATARVGVYIGRHRAPVLACECHHDCRACSLSGEWHVHPGEPCPIHPDADGDR